MKVTVHFEETSDDLGKGWSSQFTYNGVGTAEDLLYAFGRASTGAGYDWDGLEARQEFNHHITGQLVCNKFNAEF